MLKNLLRRLVLLVCLAPAFYNVTTVWAEWSSMESGTASELRGIWGSSPTDVFAVGVGGIILHYDGNQDGTWTPMQNSSS